MTDKNLEGIGLFTYEHGLGSSGSYMGNTTIDIFGHTYEIGIRFNVSNRGEAGMTEQVIAAARNVLYTLKHNREELQEALKAYYDSEVFELAEDERCDYFDFDSSDELCEVMTPKELYIVDLRKTGQAKDVEVGLFFECTWDEYEYSGVGIRFDGEGTMLEVTTGDMIY